MNIFRRFFPSKQTADTDVSNRTVEEFIMLLRVYIQSALAINLGITNLNMLPDMALFKRMLKIPTQNNKLGLAEKSRVRKVLMQDYALTESFFKEIEQSLRQNCKSQQDIQSYFFQFQGFCNQLFTTLETQMSWTFRLSMLNKKLLLIQTRKIIHALYTRQEWKEIPDQKAAWAIRKYADSLHYSESWTLALIYNVLILARTTARQAPKES